MIDILSIKTNQKICDYCCVNTIKKIGLVNKYLCQQIREILSTVPYLQINGDFFYGSKYYKILPVQKCIWFNKTLNISKYQFCTGYIRFYNFYDPEFKYRYDFFTLQTNKLQAKERSKWRFKQFKNTPWKIWSRVQKTANETHISIKICTCDKYVHDNNMYM